MSDPQKYRTKEEMDEFQQLDPIERLRTLLLSEKSITDKKLEAIEKEVEEEVLDAIAFADEAPFPEPEALYEDMFSGDNPIFHT